MKKDVQKQMQLNCPACKTVIDVDTLLVSQFRESIRADLTNELLERELELKEQQMEFNELSLQFAKDKAEMDRKVNAQVQEQLQTREEAIKRRITEEVNNETSLRLQALEDELVRKSTQLKFMNKDKAELISLQRKLEEQESEIMMRKEVEISERLKQAQATIRQDVEQENFLRLKEKEKLIEDLKLKLDAARRQVSQGSMQSQGEIQELELKRLLEETYPYDTLTQSKKGASGADLLHIVNTQRGIKIGSIYIESKNTKAFSGSWIPKLKKDNLVTKADILVLVTQVLPKGVDRFGLVDGIWVCDMASVKELSMVLRYGLLKVYSVTQFQQGAKSKSELLYNYITSSEFAALFENIVSSFKRIQDSHDAEKLKVQRLWKQRELELNQVLSSLVEHYSTMRNISDSVPEIKMFEFLKNVG